MTTLGPLFLRFVPGRLPDLPAGGDGDAVDGPRVRVNASRVEIETDPFGAQAVYVAHPNGPRQGQTVVSSSVGRLVREGDVPGRIDPARAVRALFASLAPSETLFEQVELLPSGHVLSIEGGTVTVSKGADLPSFQPGPLTMSLDDYRIELRYTLREAVTRRLAEGAGILLSGGLDSAGLLAIASEVRRGRVTAYTLAGDRGDDEELARARLVADQQQAEHVVVRISEAELPKRAGEAILAYEGLIHNGLPIAKYLFHQKLAAGTIVLSGVGADEVLAGNPDLLIPPPGELPAYLDMQDDDVALTRILLTGHAQALIPPLESEGPPRDLDALGWSQAVYMRTVLPSATLPAEVRMAAGVSVAVRVPYLDPEVVRFCAGLPRALRERDGTGKVLLRLLFEGVLPADVLRQPKVARLVPPGGLDPRAQAAWLELYDGYLAERPDVHGILDRHRVRALLDSYRSLPPTNRYRVVADRVLMRLLSLAILAELWGTRTG
ncbi:MAG: asparagine synthase C-terminal domain-containing protein [Acidobacteriota bacterium]